MTKEEKINKYIGKWYKWLDREVKNNIAVGGMSEYAEDLLHHIILDLYKLNDAKITQMVEDDKLRWYILRGASLQLRSSTSPFYRLFRKELMQSRENHTHRESESHSGVGQGILEQVYEPFDGDPLYVCMMKELENLHWYQQTIMNRYWIEGWTLDKLYKHYPWCEHVYIPHGFSPDEFEDFGEDRDSRILSVISKFFERREILGYYNWQKVSNLTGLIDLYGHGNEDLEESMGSASSFVNLIWLYNSYKVFLNPTIESAMPRSRGEAMMCGMPVVTTSYYDISDYIVHGENGFLADDYYDMIKFSKKIISDKNCFDQISKASRETAIEYFNIETYLKKYKEIFSS